ncbi:MAG: LysR family transcriptional regulator [Novosphingobium sp.]
MRGNDFMELRAFELVARRLSFSRAAEEIGMSRATLSQIVKNLENRLGVQLLNRTTRSVALTDAGHELLDRLSPALNELVNAVGNIDKFRNSPSGKIRILSSQIAADLYLKPLIPFFSQRYPDVNLEISIEEGQHDLVSRGFDAALCAEGQIDLDMITVKLGDGHSQILVAAPEYIRREGKPQTIHDLASHRCIGLRSGNGTNGVGWKFSNVGAEGEVEIATPLIVNDHRFALESALSGMGIALLPEVLVTPYLKGGQFDRLFAGLSSAMPAYHLAYPKQNFATLAFRSLIKTIKEARALDILI